MRGGGSSLLLPAFSFIVHMDFTELLGFAAAFCTTVAYLPQVVKNWRTQSAGDLSFLTFTTLNVGIVLWLVYGVMVESMPIILANVFTFILTGANLVQMIRYRNADVPVQP